jgi:hypothetical protein
MSLSFTSGGESNETKNVPTSGTSGTFRVPGNGPFDVSNDCKSDRKHHFSLGPSELWVRSNRPVHCKFEYSDTMFPSMLRFNGKPQLYHISADTFTKRKLMRTYLSRLRSDVSKTPPKYRSPLSYFHSEIPMTCAEISFLSLKSK